MIYEFASGENQASLSHVLLKALARIKLAALNPQHHKVFIQVRSQLQSRARSLPSHSGLLPALLMVMLRLFALFTIVDVDSSPLKKREKLKSKLDSLEADVYNELGIKK